MSKPDGEWPRPIKGDATKAHVDSLVREANNWIERYVGREQSVRKMVGEAIAALRDGKTAAAMEILMTVDDVMADD